jgi:hypothetical protein
MSIAARVPMSMTTNPAQDGYNKRCERILKEDLKEALDYLFAFSEQINKLHPEVEYIIKNIIGISRY